MLDIVNIIDYSIEVSDHRAANQMKSLLILAAQQNVSLTRALTVQILNCLAYIQRQGNYERGSKRYFECEDASRKIWKKLESVDGAQFLIFALKGKAGIDWATELSNI